MLKKRSFFERLTGSIRFDNEDDTELEDTEARGTDEDSEDWIEEETEEAQLTVDVYQTPTEIIVEAMTAGVKPEDLKIDISRDMITIQGKREEDRTISEENYFCKELYWGSFSRTILLPEEIDPDQAEAVEKHGLLIIKLPKIDKDRKTSIKVKSA